MALTDISLGLNTKQEFSIDGDATRIVKLDTHDVNIVKRMSDAIPKIQKLQADWNELNKTSKAFEEIDDTENIDLEEISKYSDDFAKLESRMRAIVDEVFDSEGMCDTILGSASIFSPVNGGFKYDRIIEVFSNLYGDTLKSEIDKINYKRVNKKTSKYIRNK